MCISSTSFLSSFLLALLACISYFNYNKIKKFFKNFIYFISRKSMIMKKISVENFVKTSCGIDQYNSLKKNKSIFGKLRLSWFLFFATIRDLFVSKKN